jgi:hypothetical protein
LQKLNASPLQLRIISRAACIRRARESPLIINTHDTVVLQHRCNSSRLLFVVFQNTTPKHSNASHKNSSIHRLYNFQLTAA